MTKTTTYKCDLCQVDDLAATHVIGMQTTGTDSKKYETRKPSLCDRHVCRKCLEAIKWSGIR